MIYGETYDDHLHRKMTWHRWFAWRPVTLLDGRRAWLQTVERRFQTYHPIVQMMVFCPPMFAEYRLPKGR